MLMPRSQHGKDYDKETLCKTQEFRFSRDRALHCIRMDKFGRGATMTHKIKAFTNREAAERECEIMRSSWPGARVHDMGDHYVVVVHDPDCRCGCCPMLYDDDYVQ